MKTTLKVSVLSARFAISGVPLAQMRFSRALAASGHNVDFLIGMVNPGFEVPQCEKVNVVVLRKPRVISMLISFVRYFRETRPDLVFSAGDHLNVVVLMAAILSGSKAKISCSSRVTPFDTYSNTPFSKGWILKLCMNAVMSRADVLTCVSKDMVEQYKAVLKSNRHVCVYNIVDDVKSRQRMNESIDDEWLNSSEEPIIIAAGSLVPWKGFSDLLWAMRELSKTRKGRLVILGDGPMRAELEALVTELSLERVVKILGYVENPLKYFRKADIFVLSSHVEGMPNVLVEAMMCGCTPVATNCPTGPRELLQNGRYGYLVPVRNILAMADGIRQALDSPISQELLREAVRPFSEQHVLRQHFELLSIHI